MKDDHLYCMSCGRKVERVNTQQPRNARVDAPSIPQFKTPEKIATPLTPTQPNVSDEYLVGGYSSADMARPGSLGYGIYITNQRVIGVKQPGKFAKEVGANVAGALMGAVLGVGVKWSMSSTLGSKLSPQENRALLEELERNKDIELKNRDISLIQLKETFLVNPGQLAFFLNGAQKTNITISLANDDTVNNLKELFMEHFPKVLKMTI
jgi:hypothetical protein